MLSLKKDWNERYPPTFLTVPHSSASIFKNKFSSTMILFQIIPQGKILMQEIFVSIVHCYALINFFTLSLLYVFSIQIRSVCLRDSLKMYVAAVVCYKFLKRLAMVAIIKYHMISFFFQQPIRSGFRSDPLCIFVA